MRILKYILSVTAILFFIAGNSVFASTVQKLYTVKNVKPADVKYIADFYSRQTNKYAVTTADNYTYVKVYQNSSNYYFMSFDKNNDNTYFYFYSPNESSSQYLQEILKRFKKNNLKYSSVRTSSVISSKQKFADTICKNGVNQQKQTAQTAKTGETVTIPQTKKYDFSDEAQAKYEAKAPQTTINITSPTPSVRTDNERKNIDIFQNKNQDVYIYRGEVATNGTTTPQPTTQQISSMLVPVVLNSTVNTQSLSGEDRISALLQSDFYLNNRLVAKQGSIFYASAKEVERAGRGYKNAAFVLQFDKILTTDGDEISIQTEPVEFKLEGSNRAGKVTGAVVGGALVGVAASALGAVFARDPSWGAVLTVGAVAGAISGVAVAVSATGEEIELKEGLTIQVKILSVQ